MSLIRFVALNRRTLQLLCAAGLACLPFAAVAHLLEGSPAPLPRWVPIAGLIIAGAMGGIVGFAISKHRRSMEQKKKQRLQRAAESDRSAEAGSRPPESAP